MRQVFLNELPQKQKIPIHEFYGVNTGVSPMLIGDGQAADMKNFDTRDFPTLKTRAPRKLVTTLSGPIMHMGGILGEMLTVVEGNTWKYYDFDAGAWTYIDTVSGSGQGMSIGFADQTIYVNGTTNVYRKYGNGSTGTHSNMPP